MRGSRTGPLRRRSYGLGLRFSPSIPRPGRSPGSSGGRVTSGAGRGGAGRGAGLVLRGRLGEPVGGEVVEQSVRAAAEEAVVGGRVRGAGGVRGVRRLGCGAGVGAALGGGRGGGCGVVGPGGSGVRRGGVGASGVLAAARGAGEEGLEGGDVVLHGLEDGADLVADVGELDGEPVAEAAPGGAVRAGEGVQGLDGADGAVALVGGVEQAVALGGVVGHAVERASDGAEGFVVQLAGAAALHESAGFAEPGGRLVEVGLAAVGVALGHAEADVLHPALQPVQRVTGEGVGAGSGHSAERPGCHTHGEPTGGEPLRPAGAGTQFAQWRGPVGPLAPLHGHRRARRCAALGEHGLHGRDELGSLHHFDLGVQLRLR